MGLVKELDELVEAFCELGEGYEAEYLVKEGESNVGLVKLIVPDEQQGKGHAKWFMMSFTGILDRHQRGARLMASEMYGEDLDDLINFYGMSGFVPIQKAGKDSEGNRQRLLARAPVLVEE